MTVSQARDRRKAADVGRRARLELVFACRDGRTVLADAYAEPPFRVGRSFPDGDGLHMILASAAPGIFGGDSFEQVIRLERGARVRLTSQSALQVHPSAVHDSRSVRVHEAAGRDTSSVPPPLGKARGRPLGEARGRPLGEARGRQPDHAEFVSLYHVADEASLHCQWDPMIPFAAARFEQRIDIQLTAGAKLYWSDAFMAGRAFAGAGASADRVSMGLGGATAASADQQSRGATSAGAASADNQSRGFGGARAAGERWAFDSLGHELRITRVETLEYLERYRIVPAERNVAHPWVAGEACYFGTTVRSGDATSASDAERLHAALVTRAGVRAATDALSATLWVTRVMGSSGVPFHEARRLANAHMSLLQPVSPRE